MYILKQYKKSLYSDKTNVREMEWVSEIDIIT